MSLREHRDIKTFVRQPFLFWQPNECYVERDSLEDRLPCLVPFTLNKTVRHSDVWEASMYRELENIQA